MPNSTSTVNIPSRIEKAITELVNIHEIVKSGELGPDVLADLRDALNRVRNAAWIAYRYSVRQANPQDSSGMNSFIAGERMRAAYQMCCIVSDDLKKPDLEFQPGTLIELYEIITKLNDQLKTLINMRD
jgi:hypothetical protein